MPAQCDICYHQFRNLQGLRVHRSRSGCTPEWERRLAASFARNAAVPLGDDIPDNPPDVDDRSFSEHSASPRMDWDPIPYDELPEMSLDGGGSDMADRENYGPPRSRSAPQSDGEDFAGNRGGEEENAGQPIVADDAGVGSDSPQTDGGDDGQHDNIANDNQDEPEDSEDDEGDEDYEHDGNEESEDEGDEEYEDEGGASNEPVDSVDDEDAGSLEDQSCPVDEGDEGAAFEEYYPGAGRVGKQKRPYFRATLNEKLQKDDNIYHPFLNQQEWELAKWMHESGMSMSKMDEFFQLQYVSDMSCLLYWVSNAMLGL